MRPQDWRDDVAAVAAVLKERALFFPELPATQDRPCSDLGAGAPKEMAR